MTENEIKSLLMPYRIYNKVRHTIPYFFKIEKNRQVLYYFGANHSFNPKDRQYPLIKRYWKQFCKTAKPINSMVLVEGGLRPPAKREVEAISSGAEANFVTYLAKLSGYRTFCPEPGRLRETTHFLRKYSKKEIEYYYFARVVQQWGQIPARPKFQDYVHSFLQRDQVELRWKDFDFTLENMKNIHTLLFDGEFDERNSSFFYSITNPCFRTTVINSFSQEMAVVRNAFIVKNILDKWKEEKNLFIVFGYSHAIIQESALRKLA